MKAKHLLIIVGITAILLLSISYPFLHGEYDGFAKTISMLMEIAAFFSLLSVIPAIFCILKKNETTQSQPSSKLKKNYSVYVWTFIGLMLFPILFITFGESKTMGFLLFVIWAICLFLIARNRLFYFSKSTGVIFMLFPLLFVGFVLLSKNYLTNMSRAKAIENSKDLISEIENYKIRHGKYPISMNGAHPDFKTGVIGIEKYYYSYSGDTYNLYFEQPRFFFDQIGTQEFVVYNPKDRHIILSHDSWNMRYTDEQMLNNQGWYKSFETGIPHWNYFWFD